MHAKSALLGMVLVVAAAIGVLPASDGGSTAIGGTERASVDSAGNQGNLNSRYPAISADGRFVAFTSGATNLVPGDTNEYLDVFVHDRQTGGTERVSVDSAGNQGNGDSDNAAVSADGRFVAFNSVATDLVAGDSNGEGDVFVHDRQTGATERVSVDSAGNQGNRDSWYPVVSADGRFVAFESASGTLAPGGTDGRYAVYVHDRQTGDTERVSVDSAGTPAESFSENAAISADGRFVAFDSLSDNLVPGDANGYDDVFVHDRQTGDTERVSVNSGGGESDNRSSYASLSADGRFVTFASAAGNLVAGDDNGKDDIFVHDRQTGTTSRVSVDSAGNQADDHSLTEGPRISADGRFVAFDSQATNLVPGDTNGSEDVFLHDRQTGETQRVSVDSAGNQGNALSSAPDIDEDGGFVVFGSNGSNLVTGDTNGMPDVFVHCMEGPCGAGPTPTPPPGQLLGDVNCIGGVNSVDALFVLRSVAQIEPWGDCLAVAGDVNCDSNISAVDSLQILRYVALMTVNQHQGCPAIGAPLTPLFGAR